MKRRTRHAKILLAVPILLVLAFGGWIVDAIRARLVLRERVAAGRASVRRIGPNPDK